MVEQGNLQHWAFYKLLMVNLKLKAFKGLFEEHYFSKHIVLDNDVEDNLYVLFIRLGVVDAQNE